MNLTSILDDFGLERQRRLQGLIEPDPHALVLWSRARTALVSDLERERLAHAFHFAKALKYNHVGLTGDIYFSHPLRIAGLALLLSGAEESKVGVLALLHNVLEVSDVSLGELTAAFGSTISNQILSLTVDRGFQWDKAYKSAYYDELIQGPLLARVVKIVDKLDNLFVLGLNPDESVRRNYLAEVEDFVLPMTLTSLPAITSYMSALIEDCYATGFIKRPVASNEEKL